MSFECVFKVHFMKKKKFIIWILILGIIVKQLLFFFFLVLFVYRFSVDEVLCPKSNTAVSLHFTTLSRWIQDEVQKRKDGKIFFRLLKVPKQLYRLCFALAVMLLVFSSTNSSVNLF